MKKITGVIILSIICLSLAFGQKTSLKIASYNVRYDNQGDRDNGNGWDKRYPVISSLIRNQGFDMLGCQEVLVHQLADLKNALPAYNFVGVGRDDGKEKGEYAPIAYKKEVFSLIDSGVFWLSETPDRPSTGWDAALPRICTWVKLQYRGSDKKIWHFNLHMDHVGKQAREEACKLILSKIKEMTDEDDVVLTGDFNVDQHNPIYDILNSSDELKDGFELATEKYAWNGTFNAFDPGLWTDSRIDHVFVSEKIHVKKYAVLLETYRSALSEESVKKGDFPKELSFKRYEARLPSDHFPVVIEVDF